MAIGIATIIQKMLLPTQLRSSLQKAVTVKNPAIKKMIDATVIRITVAALKTGFFAIGCVAAGTVGASFAFGASCGVFDCSFMIKV